MRRGFLLAAAMLWMGGAGAMEHARFVGAHAYHAGERYHHVKTHKNTMVVNAAADVGAAYLLLTSTNRKMLEHAVWSLVVRGCDGLLGLIGEYDESVNQYDVAAKLPNALHKLYSLKSARVLLQSLDALVLVNTLEPLSRHEVLEHLGLTLGAHIVRLLPIASQHKKQGATIQCAANALVSLVNILARQSLFNLQLKRLQEHGRRPVLHDTTNTMVNVA